MKVLAHPQVRGSRVGCVPPECALDDVYTGLRMIFIGSRDAEMSNSVEEKGAKSDPLGTSCQGDLARPGGGGQSTQFRGRKLKGVCGHNGRQH